MIKNKHFGIYCLGFLVGLIVGALGHELDMHAQYERDGKITSTAWITDWEAQE